MFDTRQWLVRTVKFAIRNKSLSVACLFDVPFSCWGLDCVGLGMPFARPLVTGVEALERCVMGLVP